MGDRYLHALKECEDSVSRNVTMNLYDRHLKPLFVNGGNGPATPAQSQRL